MSAGELDSPAIVDEKQSDTPMYDSSSESEMLEDAGLKPPSRMTISEGSAQFDRAKGIRKSKIQEKERELHSPVKVENLSLQGSEIEAIKPRSDLATLSF